MSEIVNVQEVTPHNDIQIDFNKIMTNNSYTIKQTDDSLIISPNPYKQHNDIPPLTSSTSITQGLNLPTPITQGLNLPTLDVNLSQATPITQGLNLPTPITQGLNLPTSITQGLNLPTSITQGLNLPTSITQGLNLPTSDVNLSPITPITPIIPPDVDLKPTTPIITPDVDLKPTTPIITPDVNLTPTINIFKKDPPQEQKNDSTLVSFDVDAGELIKNDDILKILTGYKNIINDDKNFDKSVCLFTNLKGCDLNNDCVSKLKTCDINNTEELKNSIINTIEFLNKFKELVEK